MNTLAIVAEELHGGEFIYRHFGATVDDYCRLANEDTHLELIDGVLTMHSPASFRHERVFLFLASLAEAYASRKKLGMVVGSKAAVVLDEERRVEPDIVFLKTEHLNQIGEVWINGPVDWIVEILSPATRDHDLGDKRRIYSDAGIPELWFIDLAQSRILIERPAGQRIVEIQRGRAQCEALAGFWIEADWLWQKDPPIALDCLSEILKG